MKGKKSLVLLLVLLVLTLTLMFYLKRINAEHTDTRDYPEIKADNKLNIALEYNPVDYYLTRNDSIIGIQYELCKYISTRSGLELNIVFENSMEQSIEKLIKGEYDIIARSIPVTINNKEELAFTIPISKNKQVLVQRNTPDSASFISNQIDLAHKSIHIPKDSPVILRLQNLSEEIAEPIYIVEEDNTEEQLVYRVAYRDIDYAIIDKKLASKLTAKFPEINVTTDITFTQLQAWALRPSSPILLDSLNVWIKNFFLHKGK